MLHVKSFFLVLSRKMIQALVSSRITGLLWSLRGTQYMVSRKENSGKSHKWHKSFHSMNTLLQAPFRNSDPIQISKALC